MAGDERQDAARGEGSARADGRDDTRTAELYPVAGDEARGAVATSATGSAADGAASRSGELAAGNRVGRYEIVELIGRGGTGVVYRAHDPRMSRAVALKVIASTDGFVLPGTQARLFKEAQILARLSHPNVVAAYDVGIHDGSVYIVMELIDGESLSKWLRRKHTRAELLQVLIAAGRGLAAAHAAGVVHRDFKPANVMVSRDGRARVVDFGLARESDTVEPPTDPVMSDADADSYEPAPVTTGAGATLTSSRSGALSGTPGYIAPEQLLGKAADDCSDQFSYAVTVFVALVGAKPYPDVLTAYGSALPRALPPAWPPSIPRKVRRVVDRGLALEAKDRHPSVEALVGDLEQAASSLRRRPIVLGAALATACASLVFFGVAARDHAARAMCRLDESAFRNVWDPARRAAVEQAFRATGRSTAGEAFELVAGRYDAFEAQWLALRRDSCEATHVRREQPERVMALRTRCLDRAREAAKTLVTALTEVDALMLDGVAGGLPPSLAACAEIDPNEAASLPADPELRAKVDEVEIGIAVTRSLTTAGNGPQAMARARQTLELARSTGHPRTIAAAEAQLGRASIAAARTGEERKTAEALLNKAIQSAAAVGDQDLVARISSLLLVHIAYNQRRIQEGEAMLPAVEAVIALAGDEAEQRVELLMGKAAIQTEHMQLDEAVATLDEVIRLAPSVDSEVRQYDFNASSKQASIYSELGKHDAAIAAQRRAVDGLRAAYGANHPRLIVALVNLSRMQARAKRRDEALATLDELRRLAALMPPSEPRLENIPQAEGEVWQHLGECGRAIPLLRDALARFSASYGQDHPRTMYVMNCLGTCLADQRQTTEAISLLERALQSRRSAGDTPSSIGFQAFDLAKVLWLVPSERARAVALVKEAKALWKQDGASDSKIQEWLGGHEAAR